METLPMKSRRIAALMTLLTFLAGPALAATVWLDELDLRLVKQGWGKAQARQSVQEKDLLLDGQKYERGVGSHAPGSIYVELDGQTKRFQATVGVDDETNGQGSVRVVISGDGKELFRSEILKGGAAPAAVDLDVSGVKILSLIMRDGGDNMSFDHVDWADAKFLIEGAAPKLVAHPPFPPEEMVLLTPKPSAEPRINAAKVYGVRPGSPFLFRIPATGARPMQFSVRDLPAGLVLDPATGIISGRIEDPAKRTWQTMLVAENAHGKAEREFRIVVGDTLALTPPMGWNDWYAHYDRITDAMMREAADIMISSGMADVGYQYVNIDDCWMNTAKHRDPKRAGPRRDTDNNIVPNAYFPDMKGLAEYIHSKGLKAGLYNSPGPQTCAGCEGSWGTEEQDARQYAAWGFDFLKYDWCSYGKKAKDESLEEFQKPYLKMSAILKTLDRDIVFNLCQYGMGEVWKWGAEVGGNCWRTAGDLGFELERYYDVARANAEHWPYAKPGAWNDPDYLLVGYVGSAAKMGEPVPCSLSPNEQYAYMSLWCLMAAPLIYSGDMTRLDEFTLNVLCNPEVIEINQDPLGVQGRPVVYREAEDAEIWTKPLEDGSLAVGLFNRAEGEREVSVRWDEIGLKGKQRVRDLWRQKDLGVFDDAYTAPVGRRGVVLLRLWPTE
jgi:alpha-galactosidase